MSRFTVTGRFRGRDGYAGFETMADTENENVDREYVLSRLGSPHGLKRTQTELEAVTVSEHNQ